MSESTFVGANGARAEDPERVTRRDNADSDGKLPTRAELLREKPKPPAPRPSKPVPHQAVVVPRPEDTRPFKPYIGEKPLRRIDAFRALARARAGEGVVIATAKNGTQKVDLKKPPTILDLIRSGGGTLYTVDLGLHHTNTEFDLPSADNMLLFHAIADIEWRVVNPSQVVHDRLVDVRKALMPVLLNRLGELTRKQGPDNTAAAEREIAEDLATSDAGARYGLKTAIVIHLRADKVSADYAAVRRELEQRREIEGLRYDNECLRETHEHAILNARLEKYKTIIKGEDYDSFALQLARNPQDVSAVVQLVREAKVEERQLFTDFLKHLLDSGAIDRWEIDDHVQGALKWLGDATKRIIEYPNGGPVPSQQGRADEETPEVIEDSTASDRSEGRG